MRKTKLIEKLIKNLTKRLKIKLIEMLKRRQIEMP